MQEILRHTVRLALVSALLAGLAFAAPQSQDLRARTPQRRPRPPSSRHRRQTGPSQPVPQKDTVPQEFQGDVEAIGNRNVARASTFFRSNAKSTLGSIGAEVERSQLIDDPIVTDMSIGRPEPGTQFRCARSFTHQSLDSDEVNAFALGPGFFY